VSAWRVLVCFFALVFVTAGCSGSDKKSTASESKRPNIVFLLTDDLDVSELAYMPNVKRLLTDEGVDFSHFYISVSLCCPSRSSILRGQYSHNTGVETNGSGNGGFETAHRLGIEKSTMGTWIQKAGYRTAYIGKYLNAYPDTVAQTYVPPGWDEFDSAAAGDPYSEFNYTLNENHHLVHYGDARSDYGTTVYVDKAVHFIRASSHKPFFVYLNVYAPHQPATPAPEDTNLFPGAHAPRTPAFDPLVETGKPRWLRSLKVLHAGGIAVLDNLYLRRIQSLQAVDRGVATLIDTLKATHQLANTYFVFSSDNGFHLGQFRMPAGKETAYDTDIHVPLIVRGPGVPAHSTSNFMVGNIDLAPTFAHLTGAAVPGFVDGRSFASLLQAPNVDAHPRHSYLLEHWRESRSDRVGPGPTEPKDLDRNGKAGAKDTNAIPAPVPDYIPEFHGVRTEHYLYVEYNKNGRELYATDTDPYELHNLVLDPSEAKLVARLHTLTARLETCRAAGCRKLENARV
jgi:N-acetylglucosamine-6-sulfatase